MGVVWEALMATGAAALGTLDSFAGSRKITASYRLWPKETNGMIFQVSSHMITGMNCLYLEMFDHGICFFCSTKTQ